MAKKLPLFELTINEDEDAIVSAIALVENPAIEKDFIAFAEQKEFKFQYDDEHMELFGPAMIPNMKIYRKDLSGSEYEVYFSKETIRKISQVFFKKGFQANLNIEHDNNISASSFTYQSVIVDKSKGVNVMDYPDGTWMVGVKVNDANIWKDIKAGKRNGFSVEGVFQLNKMDFNINNNNDDAEIDSMIAEIRDITAMLDSINI